MFENNDYLYFGSYPQSDVLDNQIINELNKLVTKTPSVDDYGNWISYDYYDNSVITPFMWFIDVVYNDEKYRGVYFTKIRYSYTNKDGYTPTDEERIFPNIKKETIYWFKFEPIKWKVLNDTNDELLLITDSVVDFMEFYHSNLKRVISDQKIYPNNWEYSNIRRWLNNNFYNTAFNSEEKNKIIEKLINNKDSFHSFSSEYFKTQNNTKDKIYLLSYHESLIYFNKSCFYDESKLTFPTKYAIINHMISGIHGGYCNWFLRTPSVASSYMVHKVGDGGNVDNEAFCYCIEGIRPIINISKK